MPHDTKPFDFFRLPGLMVKCLDRQNAVLSAFFRSPIHADREKDMALFFDFIEMMILLAGDTETSLSSQAEYMTGMMKLYDRFGRKIMGVMGNKDEPFEIRADKRFKSDEWGKNPLFELFNKDQVKNVVADVNTLGYMDGRHLAKIFSMLRPTDLIWAYAVNNYLKGKEPEPFDILYWNSDYTNVPAGMFNFYLKSTYIENRLKDSDGIRLNGVGITISSITSPAYFLSTEEDHIVLWKGEFKGARLHSGPVRFVLGKSGHVADVVNPPVKQKYGYRFSDDLTDDPEKFLESARCHEGSWWLNWHDWNTVYAGKRITKRIPGAGAFKIIDDAPGSYVKLDLQVFREFVQSQGGKKCWPQAYP